MSRSIVALVGALFFVSPSLMADEANYERISNRYVMASGMPVEAACDAGDILIKGDCAAEEKFPAAAQKGVYLSSNANKDINGWRCETTHQDVRQLLRITARVICQKKSAT